MYTSREERLRAATLRKLLVEANLDYEKLQGAWNKNKLEGTFFHISVFFSRSIIMFSNVDVLYVLGLKSELECLNANEEKLKELIEILDCHFDPEKESKGLKPRTARTKNIKVIFPLSIHCVF